MYELWTLCENLLFPRCPLIPWKRRTNKRCYLKVIFVLCQHHHTTRAIIIISSTSVKDPPLADTGQRQTGLSPNPSLLKLHAWLLSSPTWSTKYSPTRYQRGGHLILDHLQHIYANRWQQFAFWCIENKHDPFEAGIPVILDFMVYLFEEK